VPLEVGSVDQGSEWVETTGAGREWRQRRGRERFCGGRRVRGRRTESSGRERYRSAPMGFNSFCFLYFVFLFPFFSFSFLI
jgi:hypothetical protein